MTNFETQYLVTQYGLLAATLIFYGKLVVNDSNREKRAIEGEIKSWCKCVIRSGASSPGELQRAGQKVRERYPDRMNLILIAYDELFVEEISLKLPALYKFLELMDGVERNKWPAAGLAMSGKLKYF